jgi:acetolactate synthase-1/2/3 large subunit
MTADPAVRFGSDLVADLLREASVRHVSFNPGSTIRGLHESLVDAALPPELVLCLTEGIAVSVAQGYAKASGEPMAVLLHDVVGLQNASMSIYNAWCDRVPMLLIGGTGPMSKARRRPWIDWIHTASSQAEAVRQYVKWDDQPHDIESVPESFARALSTSVAVPPGPVYWCLDVDLQEQELPVDPPRRPLSAYAVPTAPAPQPRDLDDLAARLRAASMPLLVSGFAGDTPEGFHGLVELAERLHAPVLDVGPRFNFPTTHELWATGLPEVYGDVDLVVLLDCEDPVGALAPLRADWDAVPVVNVTTAHLRLRAWAHDYQALAPADKHLTADAPAVLDGLIERLRAVGPDERLRQARRERTAGRVQQRRAAWWAEAQAAEAEGCVPLERVLVELDKALAGSDVVLAAGTNERLEHRLWTLDQPRQWCGHTGGGGLGYGVAASLGVAMAVPEGTVVVDVQGDGDLLFAPQALWTASRLQLPLLVVVNNNRCYGNTANHARHVTRDRGRPSGREYAGSGLADPPVDLAALARSFGVAAWGPVTDAAALPAVLEQAVAAVRAGAPALVDVVTPGGPGSSQEER